MQRKFKRYPTWVPLAATFLALTACGAMAEPQPQDRATSTAGTRLPADIQSRASGLTWEARWMGDGLALFSTEVLAREAVGDGAAARAWLCAAYNSLVESRAANPQGGVDARAELQATWGGLWWSALRDTISDVGLRDLMHVLETNRGREPVSLADVQAAADDVLRGDLSGYFDPWAAARTIDEVPGLTFCE